MKKEWATQEVLKDVVRSHRKKIREAETPLEVNLATSVKNNNKCFINILIKKG